MRLALVLHAHLPWVKEPEPWTATERWFHEAMWECYLPLSRWLTSARSPVTLSVSPPLWAMMNDAGLERRFREHVSAVAQLNRTLAPNAALRAHYEERLADALSWDGAAFAKLPTLPHVELTTTSATHAFLPGLAPVGGLAGQIAVGRALVAARARSFWLPECAWSPEVDRALAACDVTIVPIDEHGLSLARPRVAGPVAASASGVCYAARARASCLLVWSAEHGYPGHGAYRDFYRDAGHTEPKERLGPFQPHTMTGLKYHRITDRRTADKQLYEPEVARLQVEADARDFVETLCHAATDPAVLAFDAELFGHWWHEGLVFIARVADELARRGVELVPLSALAAGSLPVTEPAPSTWGRGGFGRDWVNPGTARLWRALHHAQTELAVALARHRDASALRGLALDHAIEATLASQASDWLFMVSHDEHASYARRRIARHLEQAARWLELSRGAPPRRDEEAAINAPRTITAALGSERLRSCVGLTC